VTYAEALAVIVRLLGYDPIVKGTWPTNYLVKGAEIGVTDGLDFDAAPVGNGDEYWGLAAGVNLDDQLGLKIKFWFNEDEEIVFTKTLTKASDIVSGVIEDITAWGDAVEIDGKTYRADEFWNVWNLMWLFTGDIEDDDERFEGGDATLVLEGGYIVYMMTTQFDGSIVVSDVNAKFERSDGWDFEGDDVRFEADDFEAMLLVKDGQYLYWSSTTRRSPGTWKRSRWTGTTTSS